MSLKISRILHAGYIVDVDCVRIAMDPIFETPFSVNCHVFPETEIDQKLVRNFALSAVFISHYHDDHWSLGSLHLIDRNTPIFIFSVHDEVFDLTRELGFKKVHRLELNQLVQTGSIEVTTLKALDEDVDSIFNIRVGEINILNVVDSWIGPQTMDRLKETEWDLVLWPFQTMREIEVLSPSRASNEAELPHELLEQLSELKPKAIVPSSCQFQFESWSWLNRAFFPISYQRFTREVSELLPKTEILQLSPGQTLEFLKGGISRTTPLEFVHTLDVSNPDYAYDSDQPVPPTSEIAKNFRELSESERKVVQEFCENEITMRFGALQPSGSSYFDMPRIWKLSVFSASAAREYFYLVQGTRIERRAGEDVVSGQLRVEWLTEIPETKLFGAVKEGESLTSLYLRINDCRFDPETEQLLKDVDILEDPLLRCLYEGRFATYQKAQLQRLKSAAKFDPA